MEGEVWRPGGVRALAAAGAVGREPATEADVCRPQPACPYHGSCPGKKVLSLDQKREAVTHLVEGESIPAVVACALIDLPRSSWYYVSCKVAAPEDLVIEDFLRDCVARLPRRGFGKCFAQSRRMGYGWNHKRVYRIYKQLGLNPRRRVKHRLPERGKQPMVAPLSSNAGWSMDFMSGRLTNGRQLRMLNLIDEFNRGALVIEIDTSMPSARVIRVLEQVRSRRPYPGPSVWTTDRGSSRRRWPTGACHIRWRSTSSHQESRRRMASWNASTAASGKISSTATCSTRRTKSVISPGIGRLSTTKSARTMA